MLVFRAHPGKATKTNQDQLGELIKSLAPDDNDISFRYGCKGVDEEGLTNTSNVTVIYVYFPGSVRAVAGASRTKVGLGAVCLCWGVRRFRGPVWRPP